MNHMQLINDVYKEAVAFAQKQGWIDSKWTCKIKVDTSTRRTRSWGGTRRGVPFISLAITPHLLGTLTEYSSFKRDPEIGSVSGSAEKAIAALVVHELAHAIQYSGNKTAIAGTSYEAAIDTHGHGALWRKIYRTLRVNIINNKQWAPVGAAELKALKVVQAAPTAPSRNEAQKFALACFRKGMKASEIIRTLVGQNMKKTTASTYVYEIKSLFQF